MMFRVKGRRVQCLRSEYVPEKKRTRAVMIASFPAYLYDAPKDVIDILNNDEVDSLKKWIDDRNKKRQVSDLEFRLSIMADGMNEAVIALADKEVVKTLSDEDAGDIYESITALRKALKRAGFQPRPKSEKTAKSTPIDPNQRSLID